MTAPTGSDSAEQNWPGARIGLPRTGPGSVAGWGRRVLAICIDWVLCLLVASVVTGHSFWTAPLGWERWLPIMIFALEATVLTTLIGGSAGQIATRIAVQRVRGGTINAWNSLIRALLVCLVIPPVIYNRDQRGLHDLATDSVVVLR